MNLAKVFVECTLVNAQRFSELFDVPFCSCTLPLLLPRTKHGLNI